MDSSQNPVEMSNALIIGSKVFIAALYADNKPYVFTRDQMNFLIGLQKMRNQEAAAIAVGKDSVWANNFLTSKKFRSYVSSKLIEYSVKNGITVDWWYQFGKWLTEGKKEYYESTCTGCLFTWTLNVHEAEEARDDNMDFAVSCPACTCAKCAVVLKEEPFKPTREQVEGWKELGQRLIPKIERVHHQFSKEEFVFESGGQE